MAKSKELTTEEFKKLPKKDRERIIEYWEEDVKHRKNAKLSKREDGGLAVVQDRIIKSVSQYFSKIDLAKKILDEQPLYYDKTRVWWSWDNKNYRWEVTDETEILNFVRALSYANTTSTREKQEIVESLKQESRTRKPEEVKPTWIQFKDKIYDIKTGESFKASSKYFVTNPIPFDVSGDARTPTIDKIFKEWVGEDYVKTLYQIIAYCLLPDYPLHRLFCFIGSGLNGKSCFLNLVKTFIGETNVCSTELDTLLNSRFEVTRLHKKLITIMGETNFNEMSKTSMLKKLTGGDLIGMEYKNKNPFETVNYSKILIATNNLPTTTDKTIGFYRRWIIIDFKNHFTEKKNILDDIPPEEYSNLATNSIIVLNELLQEREFHNEGTVEERAERYESRSNFLKKFLDMFTEYDVEGFITKHSFYGRFSDWCIENKHRKMSETSLAKSMKEEHLEGDSAYIDWEENGEKTKKKARIWRGIKWKEQLNI